MADIRARSNSELIDAAFALYRRHFSVFFTLAVIMFAPSLLMVKFLPTSPATATAFSPTLGFSFFLLAIVSGIFSCLGAAAVISVTSNAYLGNGPIDVGSAIQRALERPLSVLGAYILKGIITAIGFILFIIPGFIALKSYFAVPATIVLEKRSAWDGMRRSRQLSIGTTKRIFLVLLPTWLFYLIALMIVSGISQFALGTTMWASMINLAVYAVLYPLIEIITTLLYLDIRVRSEGYDIELMAKDLDADLAS